MFLKELERGVEGAFGLAVPAENEIQGIADAAAAEARQHFVVFANLVKPLVHALEGPGVDALHADVDVQQAAPLRQVHEGRVVAEIR